MTVNNVSGERHSKLLTTKLQYLFSYVDACVQRHMRVMELLDILQVRKRIQD